MALQDESAVKDFDGTFEQAVETGVVPEPPLMHWNEFQKWRSAEGSRARGRTSKQEVELYREVMTRYHGDQWKERLVERELPADEEEMEEAGAPPEVAA